MKLIRVGAASLNQTPLDWNGNRDRILLAIQEARQQRIDLLCLPELCISGYGCEDAFHAPSTWKLSMEILQEIRPHTQGMGVGLGLPVWLRGGLFNAACLLVDGRIAGFAAKRHLAGDGLHYEPRWFKPWPDGEVGEVKHQGEKWPIGDLLFDCGGVGIGFEICEDAWVAQRPGARLASRGADLLLNPSASHFAFGKAEIRRRFVVEGSRAFSVGYLYANLLGNESGRALYDGSLMIATEGRMVAEGRRFGFGSGQVVGSTVDIDANRLGRARSGSFRPSVGEAGGSTVRVEFSWPLRFPETPPGDQRESWERGDHVQEEEFTRGVGLALFDYLRKSRSQGYVVSLSGGADSAAVSCLVSLMIARGCADLGVEGFSSQLALALEGGIRLSPRELVGKLLFCAYQGTVHSSEVTRHAAREVAAGLGATFASWEVDALVGEYQRIASTALHRDLSWNGDDLALQNIQARARGPSVWMIANLRNALLLSTSNRSEAAVGYATMDGDTCGGLSPVGGIHKTWLRNWLKWLENTGPEGMSPLPFLKVVNAQAPTAELRPPAAAQTDEEDLMPYPVLDVIEGMAIRDKLSPVEAFVSIQPRFPQQAPRQLGEWVERFFRLWSRSQWKRERYAPSFHVDDQSLDPRSWCRFPILSGGYERELAELRELLDSLPD